MTTHEQQDVVNDPGFRLATFSNEPVYLFFNLDGIDMDPAVEQLNREEATFISARHFDRFYAGQIIGPAVLSLPNEATVVVCPVVKAKHWPAIRVEFVGITDTVRALISRFLATGDGRGRP